MEQTQRREWDPSLRELVFTVVPVPYPSLISPGKRCREVAGGAGR